MLAHSWCVCGANRQGQWQVTYIIAPHHEVVSPSTKAVTVTKVRPVITGMPFEPGLQRVMEGGEGDGEEMGWF